MKKIFVVATLFLFTLCGQAWAARLISIASGNFTSSSTWGTALASLYTDTEFAAHVIGTSPTTFVSHVPGAVTLSGIAIKLNQRASSPSGTFTLTLRNVTDAVDVTSVTINVSDLPSPGTAGQYGWHMFKFGSNQTLTAGKSYALKMVCSASGSQVTVYANNAVAGSATVAQQWVTTTTAAPATGDTIHILGDYTGAGTGNTYTVTMDNTSTTLDVGDGLTTYAASTFTINNKGVLANGTSASTAYALKISTNIRVYRGGTWTIGVRGGTELPTTSTATYTMDCLSDNDYRIFIEEGGTLNAYTGIGRNVDRCYLNGDEAAAQTVLSVDSNTGWVNNDLTVIAATARTVNQSERRTVSSSTSTTITVTSGLTNAHSGTSPTQAEVALLTRGIKFTATSSTLQSGMELATTSTVDIYGAEFRYFSQSSGSAALLVKTTTGSFTLERCSIYDGEYYGVFVSGSSANNYTIKDCIGATLNAGTNGVGFFNSAATSGTSWSVTGNWYIGETGSNGAGFNVNDLSGTFQNNVAVGIATGMTFADSNVQTGGAFSGNTVHTCGTGISFLNVFSNLTFDTFTVWRCTGTGATFTSATPYNSIFSNWVFFGNAANMSISNTTGFMVNCRFTGCSFNGDTTFASTIGCTLAEGLLQDVEFENCSFGVASGIKTTHSTADFVINGNTTPTIVRMFLNSTTLASTTEFSQQTSLNPLSWIRIQKKDATTTNHSTLLRYGTLALDSAVYNTAAPSLKMTPNNASNKLESAPSYSGMKFAVETSTTATPSVWVRKSASYNGNQPRLILRKNYAGGITTDTVLDTMTVGTGTWEQLTAATGTFSDNTAGELIVDCDGTAGDVNVDDWSVT